jgi:hypothetical protein
MGNIIDRLFSRLAKYQKDNFGDNPEVIYVNDDTYKEIEINYTENSPLRKPFTIREPYYFCGILVERRRFANDIYCSNKKLHQY